MAPSPKFHETTKKPDQRLNKKTTGITEAAATNGHRARAPPGTPPRMVSGLQGAKEDERAEALDHQGPQRGVGWDVPSYTNSP